MSINQFVADMLNINSNQIEHIQQITKSDNSIVIKVKLCVNNFACPYCRNKVNIHGYDRYSSLSNARMNHALFPGCKSPALDLLLF